jgi:DNA-binding SARP family transcriptional activator
MMPLTIYLLGSFQIQRDDTPLTDFRAQSARALLAYLALEPDRPHEREYLCALLWPDQPLDQALAALRQALHRLRLALEMSGSADRALLITRHSVRLDPAAITTLDVQVFEAHIAAVRVHRHRRLSACGYCLDHMRTALDLYRGELLPGFSATDSQPFEEWLLIRRERLHGQHVATLEALAGYHAAHGDYAEAAELLRRWIAIEPWHETAHARLIDILWRAGQRGAALRQFDRCQAVLAVELCCEPGPEIQALADRVRRAEAPTVFAGPIASTQLVGRAGELAPIADPLADPTCHVLPPVGLGAASASDILPDKIGHSRLAFTRRERHARMFRRTSSACARSSTGRGDY